MYDIADLRRQEFPHADEMTYLNHAGISPLPQRTRRAVQHAIEELANNPADYFAREGMAAIMQLQGDLVRFINAADASEIVFATTTGAAINAVAQAIDWRPGDNVIFCDLEFPSNAYPWLALARDGVEARPAPADNGGLTLRALEPLADDHTCVVAASAVQFFTGHRTDLAAIGAFCRQRGILFVVDAIQAIGHMPFDVQAMGIDVLATGGMKSLLALPGVGFLYVRREAAEAMRPRAIHANSTTNWAHWLAYDLTFGPGAERFATGTPNFPGVLSIAPSLALLQALGVAEIDRHTQGLTRYAAERLTDAGYEVITPLDAAGPIVTFRSPHDTATTGRVVQYLAEQRVSVVYHLDAAGAAYIRLSFHCYNTANEIDRFLDVYRRAIAHSNSAG